MLENTLCHLPGIGPTREQRLWARGVTSWDCLRRDPSVLSPHRRDGVLHHLDASQRELQNRNPRYFSQQVPVREHWRLFPHFRERTAYVDIETTGLGASSDYITCIGLYDGTAVQTYVYGRNLEDFARDIRLYDVLVTYNGKRFDVPFIERVLGITLTHAHLDLCPILRGLGYRGGLKGCERQLGIDRGELEGVDGYFAVLLWQDFVANGNEAALETLLAYNVQDVINLERLAAIAYNQKLVQTPFRESHALPLPEPAANPFRAHPAAIKRIRETLLSCRAPIR